MLNEDPDWVIVYSSTLSHKVKIVKAILDENQIPSVEINRKDSAYTFIGEIDLYVHKKDFILTEFLIKTHEL